jgi:hypothetical protein
MVFKFTAEKRANTRTQEHTQMIASAIGRPAAKAPAIINANAENKLSSELSLGRILLSDKGWLHREKAKRPPQGQGDDGVYNAHTCPEGPVKDGQKWLTKCY